MLRNLVDGLSGRTWEGKEEFLIAIMEIVSRSVKILFLFIMRLMNLSQMICKSDVAFKIGILKVQKLSFNLMVKKNSSMQ